MGDDRKIEAILDTCFNENFKEGSKKYVREGKGESKIFYLKGI